MTATQHPGVFEFSWLIFAEQFVARVYLQGRVLVEESAGEDVWMFGVNPGGVAASGASISEAREAFEDACRSVAASANAALIHSASVGTLVSRKNPSTSSANSAQELFPSAMSRTPTRGGCPNG